jgi:hypothetical protein
MLRRLAVLVALGLVVAVPAAAQTEPARLAVTATSDHCTNGLPVVDFTVTNLWPTAVSVQTWWVADAWVFDVAGTSNLGPYPDSVAGSFTLPYDFYATVSVFATATWGDGRTTTNASWAIPVADCAVPAPTTTTSTTLVGPTTTAITEPTTTVDDGKGKDKGGVTTTAVGAG